MRLRRIELWDFRNYRRLDVQLGPGPILLVGDNAQGKTNLLEAVYLGAAMRSPRAESDGDFLNRTAVTQTEAPSARILLSIERQDGPASIDLIFVGRRRETRTGEEGGFALSVTKRVRVNRVPRRVSDASGILAAVLFTSQDIDLITGPPALRRRYLDLTMSQLDRAYPRVLLIYGRVLSQRNSLLRRVQTGEAREDELAYWDEELARQGSYIALARLRMMSLLVPLLTNQYSRLSESQEQLVVQYQPQLDGLLQGEAMSFDRSAATTMFREAIVASRRREIGAGTSLVGPHRDDFEFLLDGVSASAFGSRAQQRLSALALRLGEAQLIQQRTNEAPVLLLDDILSELDRRRSESVIAAISEYEQSLITSAEQNRFPSAFLAQASVREVRNGLLVPDA